MDNYRYGLTSTLELLLLVGQYYFSSVIHFTLMKLISIVCIMHMCQTDIRSESFKETCVIFIIVTCANIVICSIRIFSIKMVLKCLVVRCITNYDCYDQGAVFFSLPEKEEQKKQWIKFSNRKDISSINRVNICYRHFADNLQKEGLKRTKLLYEWKPVPTIIPVTREK